MATAKQVFSFALVALAAGAALKGPWFKSPDPSLEPSVSASPSTGGIAGSAYGATGPLTTFSSPTFTQVVDGRWSMAVRLQNRELRPDTGERYSTPWYEFSTPYTVKDLRGRFADDFLVVGEYDDGRTVLERWTITPITGSWAIDRPTQVAGLGTPVPPLVPPALIAVGGTWIAPEFRAGRPRERRVLIDASLDGAPISTLEFDPDGRYMLYVGTNPPGLYRRLLSGNSSQSEELLYDETAIPDVGRIVMLYTKEHASYGRVVMCGFKPYSYYKFLILVDGDNDGIFTSMFDLTRAQYDAQFEDDPLMVPDGFEVYEDI